jgi:hypothetical protein
MFMMYTYIVHITIYEIHIHDLSKFEPKTSWKHANAFVIKLKSFFGLKQKTMPKAQWPKTTLPQQVGEGGQ